MNQESLGKAAGIVWARLRDCGEDGATLASLKKAGGARPDEIVAAVGWLAREGKLRFENGRNRVSIALVVTELEPVCC